MSTRMIRTLAIAAGAGALVLSAAAPAMAADTYTLTTFPAKKVVKYDDTVVLQTPVVAGYCDQAKWTWTARVVGQKFGVTNAAPTPTCTGDAGSVSVVAANLTNAKRKKANVVVKLVATPKDATVAAEAVVYTAVVKVNPTVGKGKGNKPA